jgi:hypothetical protein
MPQRKLCGVRKVFSAWGGGDSPLEKMLLESADNFSPLEKTASLNRSKLFGKGLKTVNLVYGTKLAI